MYVGIVRSKLLYTDLSVNPMSGQVIYRKILLSLELWKTWFLFSVSQLLWSSVGISKHRYRFAWQITEPYRCWNIISWGFKSYENFTIKLHHMKILNPAFLKGPGPCFNIKTIFWGMWISIVKIKLSWDCFIFIMGIHLLSRWLLGNEMAPASWASFTNSDYLNQLRD